MTTTPATTTTAELPQPPRSQPLDVIDRNTGQSETGRAGARKGGETLEAPAGGEVGTQSQQNDVAQQDVGIVLRARGLRDKAVDELERMLGAKRFLWNAGKQAYDEEVDYQVRMKAIQEILNRTDGMPAQRSEILQALVKVGGAKEVDGDIELTPATQKVLEDMLNKARKGSKKTGGTLTDGKR